MVKSMLLYTVASLLSPLLSFVLLPIYSRYLSTSEFGIVAAMGVLSSVVTAVSTLALDRAAMRFYFDNADPAVKRKTMGTFFVASVGLACLTFMLLLAARIVLQLAYPEVAFYPYYFLSLVTVTTGVVATFVQSYLRVAEKPHSFLATVGLTVVLQLALTYFFIVVRQDGALGQIYALLLTALTLLPLYLWIACRDFTFELDLVLVKKGLSYSWPLIPTLVVAWILNWSDSIFIANYCSMSDVGLYSMGYKISMILFVVSGAFSTAFYPVFFQKANLEDQVEARKTLYSIIQIASRAFIAFGFLLALFAKDLVLLVLDLKYHDSYLVARIIIVPNVLSAIMGVSSNLYYQQAKHSRFQLLVVSGSAVLNLILNYMLVPLFGMYGAAAATLVSMIALTVVHYQFSRRFYFIDIHWWRLAFWIALAIVTVVAFQFSIERTSYSLGAKLLLTSALMYWFWKNKDVLRAVRG